MLMEPRTEQRESLRCPVVARAELRLSTGVLIEGCAMNVSMNGMLFATERTLPLSHEVHATVILTICDEECRIDTQGVVARVDDGQVAIRFTHINAESMKHLRQLVLFNSDNAESPQRGHDTLIGKKAQKSQ